MYFQKLFEMQKALDTFIEKTKKLSMMYVKRKGLLSWWSFLN